MCMCCAMGCMPQARRSAVAGKGRGFSVASTWRRSTGSRSSSSRHRWSSQARRWSSIWATAYIPGAWFAVRSRLRQSLGRLPEHRLLVLASRDGQFAALAAADAQAASRVPVRVLRGGTQAWRTAGLPCATGFQHMADRNDDIWYSPYDHDDRSAAMTAYLQWEVDLLGQISKES